jgi:hypothetical protein
MAFRSNKRRLAIVDDALIPGWRVTHGGEKASLRSQSGGVTSREPTRGEQEYVAWLAEKRQAASQ